MIHGPRDFLPGLQVEIIELREAVPLKENDGVYIKNRKTGEVNLVTGEQRYVLTQDEVLWPKELPAEVEKLLAVNERGASFATATVNSKGQYEYAHDASAEITRNPTRVVRFKAPHNSAVQLFDYKNKTHRVVFGPDLIMLQPYEDITVLRISGGIPKQENRIRNLAMLLGPDFMTDQLEVETSDHAKLRLVLAYSWRFNVDKSSKEQAMKLF